ncbi:MAG: FAD-dependent oxidoreductase [Candidatus Thermoplasmatota archaeon]|nr:FAD-dependent oxidoreductase [Candidatus Thermoplasmatota archaeon]
MTDENHIVIVGCGAGGGAAAQFARKTDRKTPITIVEQGNYPYYSKCGLPYAIKGTIPSFTKLIEYPTEWFTKERITLHLNTQVTNINHPKKTITASKDNKTFQITYNTLILATGARPWIPPIHNLKGKNPLPKGVNTLRTIEHGKNIQKAIKKDQPAIIIGGGLIGLELADALTHKGMNVSVIEALPHILANSLDQDMATLVHNYLSQKLHLYPDHVVETITLQNNKATGAQIKNNNTQERTTIDASLIIVTTGTRPETQLAQQIGCTIGKTGGIVVDSSSSTSIPNVYAVGDCTEYRDFQTKEPILVGLGSIVLRQGIAAGISAAGGSYHLHTGALLTRTSEFFNLEIAAVGPTTNACVNQELIHGRYTGSSHPDYFPGGQPITMKTGIEPDTGRIFNAQAVGANAAQRINVYATAILNSMTVDDLKRMETAYAPPIAPTLDVLTLTAEAAAIKRIRRR